MSTETQRAKFDAWWEEIENFSRRCERLQDQFEGDQFGFAFAVWQAAQASQAAEIEALRRDAKRWETVRSCALDPECALSLRVLAAMGQLPESRTASDIDAAVDAAMRTKEAS